MSLKVQRITHLTLETPDLERQCDYYVDVLNLSLIDRDKKRAILGTTTGQLAVVLEAGDAARCTKVGFQIDPTLDLADVAKRLGTEHALPASVSSGELPGIDRLLRFVDPAGTTIEIATQVGSLPPDKRAKSFVPLKLGHVATKVLDIGKTVRFYEDILGFRVSDWRDDYFVWMRCGPEHHVANFVTGDKVKLHHFAFEVKDQSEIFRTCDALAKNGVKIIYGPGRHVIGDNIFIYHRDPDGHIVEFFTELARMDSEVLGEFHDRPWRRDRPYRPTVWKAGTLGNFWGPGAPPGFGD